MLARRAEQRKWGFSCASLKSSVLRANNIFFFHLFSFLTRARNFPEKQGTARGVCDVVLVFVSPFFRFYFLELVSIRFIYIYKAIRLESGPRRTSFGWQRSIWAEQRNRINLPSSKVQVNVPWRNLRYTTWLWCGYVTWHLRLSTLLTTGIKEPVIIYPGEGSENFACIIVKFSWSPLRLCCILMTLMTPALHWQSIFYSHLFILCQGWLFSPLFPVETMRSPQSLPEHPPEYISFPFYFSTIVYSQERLKDHRWPKTFLMMTCQVETYIFIYCSVSDWLIPSSLLTNTMWSP